MVRRAENYEELRLSPKNVFNKKYSNLNGVARADSIITLCTSEKLSVTPESCVENGNKKHGHGGMALWTAVVFIVGEMAGSGVLALPQALAGTGWIGVLLIVTCCFMAGFSGIHLGKCWLILEERWEEYRGKVRNPYPSIAQRAVGMWMRHVVSFCVDFTLFGAGTVYLLLCSQMMQSLISNIFGFSFCYWVLILGAILCPLMWFGTPSEFWPVAVGALLTTAVGCILLFTNILIDGQNLPKADYPAPDFKTFFLSFGTVLFAFGGASTFPTFQNDMKDKSQFPKAATFGFIGLLTLYMPVAIGGYYVFGGSVKSSVLSSVSLGGLRLTVEILLILHFFFAFLIVVNPISQELEEFFKVPHKFNWKRCAVRSSIMALIVFVAESIPHFGKILNLVGGSTVTLMTFVFPPIFYMRLCDQRHHDWAERKVSLHKRVFLIEIVLIGVLGGSMSTYSALKDIADPAAFNPPCYINITAADA